jgi:hypothetical protein
LWFVIGAFLLSELVIGGKVVGVDHQIAHPGVIGEIYGYGGRLSLGMAFSVEDVAQG